MSIGPALDALLAALTRADAPLTKWLATGLSRAEIGARVDSLPLRLADEIYDYFAWRNGLRPTRDADYELFPGFTVLSLEEALADYHLLIATANQVAQHAGVQASSLWNERWFPLFRDAGGDYHVALTDTHPAPTAPIYAVVREDPDSAYLAYDNLTSLIQTVAGCFQAGAFKAVGEIVEEDRPRAAAIVRAHNPERMKRAAEWRP
jgi:cell wall assembly regulator SMI1